MVLDIARESPPIDALIPEARQHQRRRYVRAGIVVLVALSGLVIAGLGLGAAALWSGSSSNTKSPRPSAVLHSRTGVVTGIAQACAGPLYEPIAHLRVFRGNAATARNDTYRQVNPVARKQVPTNTTYSFVLPAGRYFITNSSTQFAHPFVLTSGSTVHLNVPNDCM